MAPGQVIRLWRQDNEPSTASSLGLPEPACLKRRENMRTWMHANTGESITTYYVHLYVYICLHVYLYVYCTHLSRFPWKVRISVEKRLRGDEQTLLEGHAASGAWCSCCEVGNLAAIFHRRSASIF